MRQHRGEEGVSEVVGVMLLVGVTVLAVAIVAVVLLSGSPPDEIPHATIVAGINESGRLALVHEGGDPLRKGEYRIYIKTESGLVNGTGNFTEPEDGVWSIGGALVYNGTGTPERVVVTAVSGGSETILAEPEFVGRGEGAAGFSPDPVEPGGGTVSPGTPGSGSGGDASSIQIVSPAEEGGSLIFSGKGGGNSYATMKANVNLTNAARVDFILYSLKTSNSNEKETLKRNVTDKDSEGNYIWDQVPYDEFKHLSSGDKVVMIVIAYDDKDRVIGRRVQVTTVKPVKDN